VTVIAPPRPPRPRDWLQALIEEAWQRARRRRRMHAAAAALLALIGVSLITFLGRAGPSQSAAPELPALPADSRDGATLVGSYGKIHEGYALIYGDGASDSVGPRRQMVLPATPHDRRPRPRTIRSRPAECRVQGVLASFIAGGRVGGPRCQDGGHRRQAVRALPVRALPGRFGKGAGARMGTPSGNGPGPAARQGTDVLQHPPSLG
jgi:hypothetical protein